MRLIFDYAKEYAFPTILHIDTNSDINMSAPNEGTVSMTFNTPALVYSYIESDRYNNNYIVLCRNYDDYKEAYVVNMKKHFRIEAIYEISNEGNITRRSDYEGNTSVVTNSYCYSYYDGKIADVVMKMFKEKNADVFVDVSNNICVIVNDKIVGICYDSKFYTGDDINNNFKIDHSRNLIIEIKSGNKSIFEIVTDAKKKIDCTSEFIFWMFVHFSKGGGNPEACYIVDDGNKYEYYNSSTDGKFLFLYKAENDSGATTSIHVSTQKLEYNGGLYINRAVANIVREFGLDFIYDSYEVENVIK